MKQYYESEVLHHLMEREGFNIPSSVPKYESEIKAYLINQVKLAYPKLTDYEAEWLLYNYTKHLPADFPVSSVSNVTEASFENVVPFAYQSAILKGQTLVNLVPNKGENTLVGTGYRLIKYELPYVLSKNKKYLVCYNIKTFTTPSGTGELVFSLYSDNGDIYQIITNSTSAGYFKTIITTSDQDYSTQELWVYVRIDETTSVTFDNVMLLEYQDGMENWDIPYFEGMQSVKMPVLTTTGKNLFDINHFSKIKNWDRNNTAERPYDSYKIKLKPNTSYTFSRKENTKGSNVYFCISKNKGEYDIEGGIVHPSSAYANNKIKKVTTDASGILYFNLYLANSELANLIPLLEDAQLEEGSTATSYEPYKSNILTVNEPIELRGIGDVKDELNCLTGEVTQRIKETVIDGSDTMLSAPNASVDAGFICRQFARGFFKRGSNFISPNLKQTTLLDGNEEGFCFDGWGMYIRLKAENEQDYLNKIKNNPITIIGPLSKESIKTVELTTVNEKGEITHFMPLEGTMNVQSSGENIQPTFDMSVPVEATTQNLASFIDLEMEE